MANALMLGGGAPTLTLQAGALAALDEKGVEFDMIAAAGAGMVIGLLYAAPKDGDRQKALQNTREMGVHDAIYRYFPVNFKIFHKPGTFANAYREWLRSFMPLPTPGQNDLARFWSDWTSLMFATWCPSDLGQTSTGLCEHAPWIEDVVDFEALKHYKGEFYINAYCIDDQKIETFSKNDITPAHFRAALAFPLIYPPFKVNGKTYIEGSAVDTLCFPGLTEYRRLRARGENLANVKNMEPLRKIDNAVIFDILSAKQIIRVPDTLYDAWIQSIMIPLVEIAENDLKLFKLRDLPEWPEGLNLMEMKFELSQSQWKTALDWSYSNLRDLYDLGYRTGLKFYEDNKQKLMSSPLTQQRKATGKTAAAGKAA